MRKKKAIKILEGLKDKVLNPSVPNDDVLLLEMRTYFKVFFGEKSDEYRVVANFNFGVFGNKFTHTEQEVFELSQQKDKKLIAFIDNCIGKIKKIGVINENKKNWISDKGNDFLIKTSIGLIIFGFWMGYWTKEFEFFSIMFKKDNILSLSSVKTRTLKSLPSDIPNKPTDSIKEYKTDNK